MAYKVDFDALDAMYYMMQGHIMTWNEGINNVAEEVSHLISGDQITGKAAENIKSYLQTVHLAIMNSLAQLFQSHIQNCLVYKSAYQAEIDADLHALIQSDELTEIRRNLSAQNSNMQEVDDTIRSALTSVSDIFYTYFVSADPMEETYRTIDMNLKNLNEDITNLENTHLNSDFTETQTLIEELKSFIHDQMVKEKNYISSYTPQILANSPAYAKLFDANMMLTEKQAEKADALQLAYERETSRIERLTEEAAQKREEEGWWKMLLGTGAAVVGVIAIIGTAGMATPVVVTAYVAGGSAIAYGVSNMVEAGQDIVYGAMGDTYTVAWNPIRDTIFCGNQTAYDIWGGISTTVAGLVVPVGQSYTFARTAGQSGKVLVQTVGKTVAKEFAEDFVIDKVSMGTGGLVQDFTGNANLSRLASLTAGVATGTQSGKAFQVMDNAAAGVKGIKNIDDVTDSIKNNLVDEIKKIRGQMPNTNLAKRGNMAAANVDIPGIKNNFVAHSKINGALDKGADVADFSRLKPDNKRIFTTYVDDQYPRYHDTEAKILEDISSQITDPNVKGTINLYSELPCCQSCSNIILEFRRMFSNIELNVFVE